MNRIRTGILGFAIGFTIGWLVQPAFAQQIGNYPQTTAVTQPLGDNTNFLATDAFVAAATAGLNPAVEVDAATAVAGDTSGLAYNNGTAGVGATLTGTANTAITIDGFTFTATSQRLLVKNDTQSPSGAFNGVYTMTTLQAGGVAPVFTRATDYNTPSNINATGVIPVVSGTANAGTFWYLTSNVVTIGTTPITYAQFSSTGPGFQIATNSQIWSGGRNKIIDGNGNHTSVAVVVVPISTATFTPNFNNEINFSITLSSACPCTLANPSNAFNGLSGFIEVIQDGSGSRTITTYGSTWKFPGGTKPTLSTGASAKDVLPFFCDSSTFCMVGAIQQAFQ